MIVRALLLFCLVAACDDPDPVCERWVRFVKQCEADKPREDLEISVSLARETCADADKDPKRIEATTGEKLRHDVFAKMREMKACMARAATCAEYEACNKLLD